MYLAFGFCLRAFVRAQNENKTLSTHTELVRLEQPLITFRWPLLI